MRYDVDSQTKNLILAAKAGDRQAMEALIMPHGALIHSLAGRFDCPYVSADELLQAGYVGFIHAVHRYDAEQGASLITYAVPWILGEIRRQIREFGMQAASISLNQACREDENVELMDRLCFGEGISLESLDLRMALSDLSKDEQLVICLRYFRDKTQKETAELLRRSQTQVSRIERRAIDRLHELLA